MTAGRVPVAGARQVMQDVCRACRKLCVHRSTIASVATRPPGRINGALFALPAAIFVSGVADF